MHIGRSRLDRRQWLSRFTAGPFTADLLLAVFLIGVVVIIGLSIDSSVDSSEDLTRPSTWWHWPLLIGSTFMVPFRRLAPTVALVVGGILQAGTWLMDLPDLYLGTSVLLYSAAAHGGIGGRRASWITGLLLTGFTVFGVLADEAPFYVVPIIGLYSAAATALGISTANRQAYIDQVEARAADLEQSRKLDRDRAMIEERARIARELHDVVAHGLSVIVVQASAAQRILDRDPAGTSSALQQIEQTGRTALNEMRQVLGAIRTEPSESYHPARGLGSLQDLVSEMERTGLQVTVVDSGQMDSGGDGQGQEQDAGPQVPATMDLTAYRIVQESLTNVLKHGGRGAKAEVHINRGPSTLELRITDNGQGAGAIDGGGHGLQGMRERVEVFGGRFDAGPQPGGGFVVSAVLPVDGAGAIL